METIKMVDAIGRQIISGDFILYTMNNYLAPALVERVTHKTITYKYDPGLPGLSKLRSYDHVVIVPEQEIMRMILELNNAEGALIDDAEDMRDHFKLLYEYKQNNIDKYGN